MKLTEFLKKYRIDHNLTQTEMANIIGIKQCCLSLIESGKLKPGFKIVKLIADSMHIEVEQVRKMMKYESHK